LLALAGMWLLLGGLLAALLAASYPAFVFNTGRLLSEPLAEVTAVYVIEEPPHGERRFRVS
jgi:hypothetical protein